MKQTFGGGSFDAFVAKFDPRRSREPSLVYGTYLGNSGDDQGSGIAVDGRGNPHIVGTTNSNQFPHTRSFGTGTGATFLVKLSLADIPCYIRTCSMTRPGLVSHWIAPATP